MIIEIEASKLSKDKSNKTIKDIYDRVYKFQLQIQNENENLKHNNSL